MDADNKMQCPCCRQKFLLNNFFQPAVHKPNQQKKQLTADFQSQT